MKGRPPISEAEKEAKGTRRQSRDRGDVPEVESAILPPPDHLTERARAEWKRVMPILARSGLFTPLDLACLEGYCVAYALSVEAQMELEDIREKGAPLVVGLPNGFTQAQPLLGVISSQQKLIQDFSARFGLDPVSRSKIRVKKKEPEAQRNQVAALRERKRA